MTKQEYLNQIESVIKNGTYKDTWQSLSHHKTPEWYYRDKFGIFIHWGVYSVPAYGSEWYSRAMYDRNCREFEYHRKTYGTQDKFGYKDFIRCSELKNSALKNGWRFLKKREQNLLCPCVSIMTALQCMTRRLTVGTPKTWDH